MLVERVVAQIGGRSPSRSRALIKLARRLAGGASIYGSNGQITTGAKPKKEDDT